jgi:hypothetical protein
MGMLFSEHSSPKWANDNKKDIHNEKIKQEITAGVVYAVYNYIPVLYTR